MHQQHSQSRRAVGSKGTRRGWSKTTAAVTLAAALLAASCGSDDDDTSGAGAGPETTAAPATAATSEGGDPSAAHQADGTISYAFSLSTPTLDPGYITSIQAGLYLNPVYDRITYIDPVTGVPGPMLATEWEVGEDAQGAYVDFTLQEGLTFPDGAEFGPQTVIANIERSKDLAGQGVSGDLAAVTGVEEVAPNVVRLRADTGAATFPGILGGRAGMMISQDALANPDLATNPVGIGMWTLERFDPALVTYTATPGYWDPEAQQSERLELSYLPDDSSRFNALRSGDLDVTFIRTSQLEAAEEAGLNVLSVAGATNYIMMLNTSVPGLDNPDVRRALQHAIDRDGISEVLLDGRCTPTQQLFPPSSPYADAEFAPYSYDPDQARQLLEDAGYGDGLSFDLLAYDIDFYRRLGEVVQAQLAQIGVTVNLTIAPASEATDLFVNSKQVDASMASPGLESDPADIVNRYLMPGGLFNPGPFTSPEVSDLAAEGLSTTDQADREAIYQELSQVATNESPFLAVCAPEFLYASDGEIAGFEGGRAAGAPEWRGVAG